MGLIHILIELIELIDYISAMICFFVAICIAYSMCRAAPIGTLFE